MGITQYFHHAFAYLTLVVVGAIALELLQFFSPGRHVTAADLLANLAGVVLGCGIAYLAGLVLRRTDIGATPVGPKTQDP